MSYEQLKPIHGHFVPRPRQRVKRMGRSCKRAYEFICAFYEDNEFPPTIREIGEAIGLSSSSTVWTHVQTMASLGLVTFSRGKPRSITPTGAPTELKVSEVAELIAELASTLPPTSELAVRAREMVDRLAGYSRVKGAA